MENKDATVKPERKIFNFKNINWGKTFVNTSVIAVVFLLGVAVGDNRIKLGTDGIFRKSVQSANLGDLDYSGVNEVYDSLVEGFDGELDKTRLEDGLKSGLVKATGDPYTEYFNESEAQDFNEQLSGSFEGIGAELGKEEQFVVIISPISGFPAEKAGLLPGDKISKIDGESAYDISISDAVDKIRGKKGTKVKLEIVRGEEIKEYEITRDTISVPSVKSEVNADGIGILTITRFGEDTVKLVNDASEKFRTKNVKGVVLDMRGNPGGLLDAAVGVSQVWLDKGDVVLEEKRGGKVIETFRADGNPVLAGVPTVVLINDGSASASEIVAGALHDNKVAKIYGQKSYGKGSVQEIRELSAGGLLKVTIARWFTPDGVNIDKEGILPDKEIELTAKDRQAKKDPQLEAALKELQK